jgi:hypothetical protein
MLLALLLLASEFGHAGQFVPAGSVSVSRSATGSDSTLDVLLAPELAWFVSEHFAAGIGLRYEIVKATVGGVDQGTQTIAGLSPFAAYDIPLTPLLSLFPRAGLEFLSGSGDRKSWGVSAFVPVLLHPAPHFFLGFGPSFFAELIANVPSTTLGGAPTVDVDKTFTFGARTVIGGYF